MSRILLSSLFFLTLLAVIIPFHHPVAAVDAAQWTSVNIPAEGAISVAARERRQMLPTSDV